MFHYLEQMLIGQSCLLPPLASLPRAQAAGNYTIVDGLVTGGSCAQPKVVVAPTLDQRLVGTIHHVCLRPQCMWMVESA